MFRRIAQTCLAAALLGVAPVAPALAAPELLTILHTNDTHDHLEPFNAGGAEGIGGIARRTTLFRRIRKETPATLVLDAGDVFQGTPLFNFYAGEPDYMTMAQAGYDVLTVGNHDLDNGLENLQQQVRHLGQGRGPVSANMLDEAGKPLFESHREVQVGKLKVAVIGALGVEAFHAVAEPRRKGVQILEPLPVLRELVGRLRPKVDLVVLLTHIGHEGEVELAHALPEVDLIVGGHSHTKVEAPVVVSHPGGRNTLVVQAFQWGQFVGRLDLQVEGRRIVGHTGRLIPVTADLPPDPAVAATVARYADRIAVQMKEVVGRSEAAFTNSRKRDGDTPLGNLIADVMRETTGTDVGLMNSGGIRAPLPKGPITRGMVFSMLPFENYLVTFACSGAELQRILDFAASRNGKSGSLQVSGVRYTVDGVRATEVTVNGRPLDPAARYRVTTNDYIAQGNDGAEVFRSIAAVGNTGLLMRDAFLQHLSRNPVLSLPEGGRIRKREATPARP
ncbi:MAG: 5'-nucleotidase C-terminal domain-containing protein [Candidatus Sericytochromatia bacterium]|nr:5'-nucleotidase C-terminal domain-containing protein [Candidatus Sericytochromatia bacterium]